MRKQIAPKIDDEEYFTQILTQKQKRSKKKIKPIKAKVFAAYKNYLTHSKNLGSLSAIKLTPLQKNALQKFYSSETKGLKELKEKIVLSLDPLSKDRCPYCGYREPGSFDHYLPKAHYAEFSIYSRNLIWVCQSCNLRKLDNFTAATRCLNTYYDAIPDERFLYCDLSPPFDKTSIKFYLRKPKSMTLVQFQVLTSHFKQLRLEKSYIRESGLLLSNWIKIWKKFKKVSSKNMILKFMRIERDEWSNDFGKNHYQVALMEAAIKNIDDILK